MNGSVVDSRRGYRVPTTIPVILDARWTWKQTSMVRGVVFTIESDGVSQDWSLGLGVPGFIGIGNRVPILLLHLSAIVVGSLREDRLFNSPEVIETFFNAIERHPDLEVSMADIWLPMGPQRRASQPVKRGSVLRIPHELFSYAWQVRNGFLQLDALIENAVRIDASQYFSGEETEAFQVWTKQQMEQFRTQSPKNPELVLPRSDGKN